MYNVNVIFRVEVDDETGLGHFYRCYALSEILISDFNLKFSFTNYSKLVIDTLNNHIPFEIEKNTSIFVKNITQKSIIVIDGYNFKYEDHKRIKDEGHYLILIDDFPNKKKSFDAIINSDPYVKNKNYFKTNENNLFLGLEYMIVRKNFFLNRDNINRKSSKKWLISFGGTSNLNLYFKFLLFLNNYNKHNFLICEKTTVILNNSQTDLYELLSFVEQNRLNFKVEIFQNLNTNEIIQIMDETKYAILPGSGFLREAILRNIFCLTGYFVDNQKPIAKYVSEIKISENLGNLNEINFSDFSNSIDKIIKYNLNEYEKINSQFDLNQIVNLKSVFKSIQI